MNLKELQIEIHSINRSKGFWDQPRNQSEIICLIHSELSEALEAVRHDNPPSDHIPAFSGLEEELADVVIRVLDYAAGFNLDLEGAIRAKIDFNSNRPFMHGKKF